MIKRISITILFILTAQMPLMTAPTGSTTQSIKIRKRKKLLKNEYCQYKIQFESLGVTNRKRLAKGRRYAIYRVNKSLRKKLLKAIHSYRSLCNYVKKDGIKHGLDVTIQLKITYISKDFVSVYYTASDYMKGAAYPNNTYQGYNYSLKTGKMIALNQLLTSGWQPIIGQKIQKSLLKQKVIHNDKEFHPRQSYSYYLTLKTMNIINLYDVHALQSVHVNISLSKIKKLLNKEYESLTK